MMLKCQANGINFHVQLRSLSWRETDERAEAIVSDPKRRCEWKKGTPGLNDAPPKRKSKRKTNRHFANR